MGILEKQGRYARRVGQVQKALLAAALAGGIALTGGAPPSRVLASLGGKREARQFRYQAKNALASLLKKGYIVFTTENSRRYARITPAGQRALAVLGQRIALNIRKKKRWDKD